ncbi:hypothetical protein BDW67DRAFT_138940 [Aspergillus spinulosporus]
MALVYVLSRCVAATLNALIPLTLTCSSSKSPAWDRMSSLEPRGQGRLGAYPRVVCRRRIWQQLVGLIKTERAHLQCIIDLFCFNSGCLCC